MNRNENFLLLVKLLVKLHKFLKSGEGDCDDADLIREQMDKPWLKLSEIERPLFNKLSGDMYNDKNNLVTINYTNYKGERSTRTILPIEMYHGYNEWHTEPQWLLEAIDFEKEDIRNFAIKDIHSWILVKK